ncbi:MAG: MBL fold metallo-hydrolase [Myxococcota bacterium]
MKSLHRPDLYSWSTFDEARNVDFHGLCWVRPDGNVLVDPLPLSPHDRAHLAELGGAAWIVVTNSDHTRAAADIAAWTGAKVCGPRAEEGVFPADRWLGDGEEVVPGLVAIELHGSKTPGELALLLDGATLITGDLVRAHRAGRLMMLPDAKLVDKAAAVASVRRLAALPGVEAVLVGDGWQVFRGGGDLLRQIV